MEVLVTGGAGYIGSHTVNQLKAVGITPIVLDNLVYGHRYNIQALELDHFYVGDIGDPAILRRIFNKHKIQAVMHFSAFAYVGESVTAPDIYYRNNTVRTLELIDRAVESGVKCFVFSSTCASYGMAQSDRIDEDHPQNPINPYGRSKLMVEQFLKDYEHAFGLRHVILRYFNAAGADPSGKIGEDHDPETHLIPLVLYTALGRRDSISIFGTDYDTPDGTCIRDYIHVNDLADAHILGMQHALKHDESLILNLGNGNGYSVREVINTCRKVTGKDIKAVEADRRPGDPPRLVASAHKAHNSIGWDPKFPDLETIIAHAWNWHRGKHAQ